MFPAWRVETQFSGRSQSREKYGLFGMFRLDGDVRRTSAISGTLARRQPMRPYWCHDGWVRRSRPDQPELITSLPESRVHEFDRRRRRYALLMSLRLICLLAAVLTYNISLLLALALVVGGAVLPWCAVLIANDGPARRRARSPSAVSEQPKRSLPAAAPTTESERTIDG